MSKFERHFFVCQMQRPPQGKPSCGARGAAEVFNVLQEALGSHPELWGKVQLTAAGCLGPCFDGPSIVVYPEGVWYAPVTAEGAREIAASHLVGGARVDRLVYRWPDGG
jgi:(2Fe-2S) ferredoxin